MLDRQTLTDTIETIVRGHLTYDEDAIHDLTDSLTHAILRLDTKDKAEEGLTDDDAEWNAEYDRRYGTPTEDRFTGVMGPGWTRPPFTDSTTTGGRVVRRYNDGTIRIITNKD